MCVSLPKPLLGKRRKGHLLCVWKSRLKWMLLGTVPRLPWVPTTMSVHLSPRFSGDFLLDGQPLRLFFGRQCSALGVALLKCSELEGTVSVELPSSPVAALSWWLMDAGIWRFCSLSSSGDKLRDITHIPELPCRVRLRPLFACLSLRWHLIWLPPPSCPTSPTPLLDFPGTFFPPINHLSVNPLILFLRKLILNCPALICSWQKLCEVNVIIPVLQMRKLKFQKDTSTSGKRGCQDLNQFVSQISFSQVPSACLISVSEMLLTIFSSRWSRIDSSSYIKESEA